ncbi:MAG: hypothetical protein HDR41_00475 [Lactobacillus sp.]|nr:hypothetical protein [Lactobacillus sp.]
MLSDYETKMLEREQLGEERGEKRGEERGKLAATISALDYLKTNGASRERSVELAKRMNSDLSDEKIQKIVDKYYK